MRQSRFFAPTLRQVKADNEGHALLLRGGYVRQLGAGLYSYLPLGWRVLRKIEGIVREEMDRAGAIELLMPAVQPLELWQESGRDVIDVLFHLKDGKGSDYVLGPTHEEVTTDIIRHAVSSYKALPITLYQIQTKFRDEPRPRAGLLRGREFIMKDAYSFDRDLASLDASFDAMVSAYKRIFARLELPTIIVQASGGGIGGFDTQEFMTPSPSGEDTILFCDADGYAANLEIAASQIPPVADRDDISDAVEEFATPGIVTIEALTKFEGGADAQHQIKTLVYIADGKPVVALLRGDHQLVEPKLQGATGAGTLRPAQPDEIFDLMGAHPGSLGAVGFKGAPVYADEALKGRARMTTGANKDGFHLRGVDVASDIPVESWADLREAKAGEHSPLGGGQLQETRAIEMSHVFKLGNKYTKAMGAKFLDDDSKEKIMEMGCYGIGVSRIMAALAEIYRDERGVIWPASVAPFEAHLLLLDNSEAARAMAENLYTTLEDAGVDVLFDDRDDRAGAKFADADLFGIPVQLVIGKRAVESGEVEVKQRKDKSTQNVPLSDILSVVRPS